MGRVVNYLPAGYSDSEDEYYDDYSGYYMSHSEKESRAIIEKPAIEIFKNALLDHVNNSDIDALRNELDNGSSHAFDIDSDVSNGWNLLFYACFNGLSEVVEFLIKERGVNTNLYIDYESPLMIACKSTANSDEIFKIVKLLVKESTNVNATNSYGMTSLMMACLKGHVKTVEFLMNRGASIDAIDNNGYNALFHAIDSNQVEIAKMLIDGGIDLNVCDKMGNTAKMNAMGDNREEILKLFPPEEYRYQIPTSYMSFSQFEALIPNTLGKNDVPTYFPDIMSLLRGMDSERLAPAFAIAEVSLQEFLTISDARLEEIGIEMPFQRSIIQLGLFNFFNAKWSRKSLSVPVNLKSHVSSLDLIYVLANTLRQTVVMKCQLEYYRRLNFKVDASNAERFLTLEHLQKFQEELERMRGVVMKMKPTERSLLIEKKTPKILSKIALMSIAGASALTLFYLFKR